VAMMPQTHEAPMSDPITVDVVSDVVCPWCFVGKRRLEAALKQEGGVLVRWRPYQLDATIPAEGLDRKAYMSAKFRDEGKIADIHSRLTALGAEAGIAFDFANIKRSPNTLDAHRLIRFADEAGVADAVVERLFTDYFERGRDIGDREVLVAAGRDWGLDPDALRTRLASDEGVAETQQEIEAAQKLGVSGVPFFIFASKFAVSGAQSEQVFAEALSEARKAA
jgi:predicted DsbA family dithiol-disulfide isomerase